MIFSDMKGIFARYGLFAVLSISAGGFAFFSFIWGRTGYDVLPLANQETWAQEQVAVFLDFQGERYKAELTAGSSALDLMEYARQSGQFSFEGREYPGIGFFVDEVAGIKQDPRERKYWIYYINGKKATVGVSSYKLQEGDVISWKYEDDENF